MATKLARMVIYVDRLLIIKSYKALIMGSCKITWQTKNHHISITRMSMATKLGRMIASLDGLVPIMLHDPLITWPCQIRGSLTEDPDFFTSSPTSCLNLHLSRLFYLL